MDTIPVLISINATARREEQVEPIAMLTSGTMTIDKQSIVLRYEETLDETQPPQPVELMISKDLVSMTRSGDYETSMVFCKGQRFEGQYRTPVGSLTLAIYCTRLRCEITRDGGELSIGYQLDLNGRFVAMHDMELTVFTQDDE